MTMTDDDIEIERQHDLEVEAREDKALQDIVNRVFGAGIAFERNDLETGKYLFTLPKEAKKLLDAHYLELFLELVGEKNVSQIMRGKLGSSDEHVWCVTRNELRAEFVAAANKRLGGLE